MYDEALYIYLHFNSLACLCDFWHAYVLLSFLMILRFLVSVSFSDAMKLWLHLPKTVPTLHHN